VRYTVLADINCTPGRREETSWAIRRQEYPRVVEFRVRIVRIAAVIYVDTHGLPDLSRSSIYFGSTGVPGSHPREIAFVLRSYIDDFLTPVSLIILKIGSPRSS
jgi:hypothetical protein